MKNEKLVDVKVFCDNDSWFLKLTYHYEDEKGLHELIFPKAKIPLYHNQIPDIINARCTGLREIIEAPVLNCNECMYLFKDTIPNITTEPVAYVDKILVYNIHEMTLDEIETKLGYKTKIVNSKEE